MSLVGKESKYVQRALSGDRKAFGHLAVEYQQDVRVYLAVRVNDSSAADDLAQDVFLTAFKKLATFDPGRAGSFRGWLLGIATNLLRNYRRKRHPDVVGGVDELDLMVEQEIGRREGEDAGGRRLDALRACLRALSNAAGKVVEWRYKKNLSIEQLCERLGCKYTTAAMRVYRIHEALRQCIEKRLAKEVNHER